MPDMYDKLGDLLNEALDSGYIPQENKEKKEDWKQEDLDSRKSKSFDSGLFSFNFFENQVKNEKNKVEIDNNNQKNQPKSEKIKVAPSAYCRISEETGASKSLVYMALRNAVHSQMAQRIRDIAINKYGGVIVNDVVFV